MQDRRYKMWRVALKGSGIVIAVLLWLASIQFSADGFNVNLPGYKWMAYLGGIAVTVIELIFTEEGFNHTLTMSALGLAAYVYDIVTNIMGIAAAQRLSIDLLNDPMGSLVKLAFPITLALILSISPEQLFLWGIIGTGYHDLLGQIFGEAGTSPTPRSMGFRPPQQAYGRRDQEDER